MKKQVVLELLYYFLVYVALLFIGMMALFLIDFFKEFVEVGSVHWGSNAFGMFK